MNQITSSQKLALHWQILIALVLAIGAGLFTQQLSFSETLISTYSFVGDLFLNALKMIIVPLIVSSLIVGIANLGTNTKSLGSLGSKTIALYFFSSLAAILIGLLVVNITQPGISEGQGIAKQLGLPAPSDDLMAKVAGKGASDIIEIFKRMIPTNIVSAAANGQMLGIIFFSLLFGFFLAKQQPQHSKPVLGFFDGVFHTMMAMTLFIMLFAPIGVFALVAKTVATTGFAAFKPLLIFFVTVFVALSLHAFLFLPLMLKIFAQRSPIEYYTSLAPALLTAFSTASSSATLPITMRCVEENAGISNKTSSFVLPLGATINMDGTALYECIAALFIAQAYGLDLSFAQQFLVVVTALLTSIGVAGIPAASLVAIGIILTALGLPIEALGLLLVTDRILDMCRTAVNVLGDTVVTAIVDKHSAE